MSNCGSCSESPTARFQRFGLNVAGAETVVALVGNPNVGKTTVFNALTGLRMHVGNWPGKTVARATGGYRFADRHVQLVDLPGAYSLLATSPDEEVTRDFLVFGQPDVTVVVCDSTALERNLNLVLQVLEITGRVVVALNLIDEAERRGIKIDERSLARDLGVPVIAISARVAKGVPQLLQAIDDVAAGKAGQSHPRPMSLPKDVERALHPIEEAVRRLRPDWPHPRWIALRLLEGDTHLEQKLREGVVVDVA